MRRNLFTVFWIFPVSQIILFVGCYREVGYIDIYAIIGLILSFISDVVIFSLLLKALQREAAEQKLKELQLLRIAYERKREMLEKSQKNMIMLRETIKKEFEEIRELVENRNIDVASNKIDSLSKKIDATRVTYYTNNTLVNAVIIEKNQESRELYGTDIDVSVNLPERVLIEPLDLCSVFSNLLDNSIDAIGSLSVTERKIQLQANCVDGYMIVSTMNSASIEHANRKKRKNHGYGIKILKSIAEKYKGDFRTDYSDSCFKATIIMKMEAADVSG